MNASCALCWLFVLCVSTQNANFLRSCKMPAVSLNEWDQQPMAKKWKWNTQHRRWRRKQQHEKQHNTKKLYKFTTLTMYTSGVLCCYLGASLLLDETAVWECQEREKKSQAQGRSPRALKHTHTHTQIHLTSSIRQTFVIPYNNSIIIFLCFSIRFPPVWLHCFYIT